MAKIVRLTESELIGLIKKVISEQSEKVELISSDFTSQNKTLDGLISYLNQNKITNGTYEINPANNHLVLRHVPEGSNPMTKPRHSGGTGIVSIPKPERLTKIKGEWTLSNGKITLM